MVLSRLLALALIPNLAPGGVGPQTRSGVVEELAGVPDLRVSGFPLQGEPLALEVHGAPWTAVLLRIDVLPLRSGKVETLPGLIPGARAASARPTAPVTSFIRRGTTDTRGVWREALESLPAGTELRVHGYTRQDGALREFEALELTIHAPDSSQALGPVPDLPIPPGLGTRPCAAREDIPDLAFADSNCDGIDGDVARAVFVATTGSAANPGTMELPLDDVNAAIQLAASAPGKDHVYVSEGAYAGQVTLLDGVSVWGGYSAANGWQRASVFVTELAVGGVVSGNQVGVRGANLASPMVLGSVTVVTSLAPASGHNYGILLQNSAGVTLQDVTVAAGPGGLASGGGPGTNGGNGSRGGNSTCDQLGCYGGAGGSGAHAGGRGGNGGVFNGATGSAGSGSAGGQGGTGGVFVGGDGSNGGNGGVGAAGSGGAAGSNVGTLVGGFWAPSSTGGTGGTGAGGSGGGGGGGGAGDFVFQGGGGAGGGGGGFGGAGGTGGRAGGSSFALCLAASDVTVQSCNLIAGIGRNGGAGGAGGIGGNGGASGTRTSTPASVGGSGGAGGKGGNGGNGGGGGGGNSYAILADAQSTLVLQSSTLSTSTPGSGGPGGNPGLAGEAALVKQL